MLNPLPGRRWVTPGPALLILVVALCLALSLVSIGAPGQSPTGTLSGTVRDLSGGGTRATITVTDSGALIRRTTRSNASGAFAFPQLPPGQYDVETWAPGFVVFQLHAVTVYANQDVTFSIALAPHAPGATSVAQEVEVSGELVVLVEDDFDTGLSSTIHELRLTGAGGQESLDVSFVDDGKPHGFASGDHVTLKGFRYGNSLFDAHVTRLDSRVSALDTVTTELVSGDRAALVMSLRTNATSPMCTNETLDEVVFTAPNSVRNYYAENSYGLMSVSGTVSGPYTVKPWSGCNLNQWTREADKAAQAAGVNLSAYQHLVYILPAESAQQCTGFAGRATLGGSPGRVWINATLFNGLPVCTNQHVHSHEVGHNIGLRHANTPGVEYGDDSDTMGTTGIVNPHFNAPHKVQLGWLPTGVQPVSEGGNYRMSLLQTASGDVKTVKLAVPSSSTDSYYLSYRTALGIFDGDLDPRYVDKTSVHRWDGSGPTILLANLAGGESFSENGITVTQTANDATYAYVAVAFDAPPPDTTPPSAPANLTANRKGSNVGLLWTASTDNIGVASYDVYRNNAKIASTTSTAYTDSTTSSGGGTYAYHVVASDAAGNVSTPSNTATIIR